MKNTLKTIFIACLFIVANYLQAQTNNFTLPTYNITEDSMEMSKGKQIGFAILIPDISPKEAGKDWKRLIKDYKAKINEENKELIATGAKIESISVNPINIYSLEPTLKSGGAQLSAFFDIGDEFISSTKQPEKAVAVKKLLTDFALTYEKNKVANELENEEKNLKKLENDLKKLAKDNKDLHENIEKWKKQIKQAQDDIEQNIKDQTNTEANIKKQTNTVKTVKNHLSIFETDKKKK